MRVSLNTYNNLSKNSFCSDTKPMSRSEKKYIAKRTMRTVSECTAVAFAVSILYFAMKKNIMQNSVVKELGKIKKRAEAKLPELRIPG